MEDNDLMPKMDTRAINLNDFQKQYTFDEAIKLTGDGIYQFKVFIIFGLSIMCFLMESTNMAFALPLAQCDLKLSIGEQAAINSIGFIAAVITNYFWGFLSDTWGRKNVLISAYIIMFVFSSMSSLCNSATAMLLARFCVGVGIAPLQPSVTAYLSEFHCNENRTKWLSKINIFTCSVFLLQPILSLIFVKLGDIPLLNGLFLFKPWRLFLFSTSLIPLICFLMILNLPESPKFLFSQGKYSETLDVLRNMHKINYRSSNMHKEYPVNNLLKEVDKFDDSNQSTNLFLQYMYLMWKHTKPLFLRPHSFNMSMLCCICGVLYMGVHGIFMWFPYLMSIYQQNIDSSSTLCEAFGLKNYVLPTTNSSLHSNLTQISTTTPAIELTKVVCTTSINSFTFQVVTVMATILLFVQIVIAIAIEKFGPKYVLLVGFLFASGSAVLSLFTRSFYLNVFLIKFSAIGAGLCTILYTIASDLFPTQNKSMAISFIGIIGRIASAIGGSFVGPLLMNYCIATMTTFATLIVCCSVMSFYILIRLEQFNRNESSRNI